MRSYKFTLSRLLRLTAGAILASMVITTLGAAPVGASASASDVAPADLESDNNVQPAGRDAAPDSAPANGNAPLPEIEELDQDLPEASLGAAADLGILAFSPAGCLGTTYNPHSSGGGGYGEAVVKGNTTCTVAVPGLAIRTTLHRSRWYGWQQVGDSGMRTNSGVRAINTNVRYGNCYGETHDWQGRTYHESREPTGTYYAGTQNTKRFTC